MDFLSSFLIGLFFVLLTFLFCAVLVVGIKVFALLFKPSKEKLEDKKGSEKAPPRKRKPIRSIEINPDQIDRIYVKKVS